MGRRSRTASRALVGASSLALAVGGLGAGALPASAAESAVSPVGGAWTVHGHGYGHGHGLSQWGAQSRAVAGQSATQILDFYYPGTSGATGGPRDLRVALTTWAGPAVRVRSAGPEALTISTSARTVAPDQVLVLTRDGTSVVGTALAADGSTAWAETWASAPTVAGTGRVALVSPAGAGTVYEGTLTFPTGGGNVVPVDTVDLEAYLRGVVPAESSASWRPAALQAQAVAARSYVLSTLAPGADHDTCDTTACQVYRGYASLSASGALSSLQPASTNDAVAATAGRYRAYAGAPAFTQFSASNGGWTSAGGKPYLAAAADPYSTSTGSAAGDDAGSWTAQLSVATVSASCPTGGTATALAPSTRDGNGEWGGRVTSARLTCTTGSVVLSGAGAVRFGLRSNWWDLVPTLSGGAVDAAYQALGGADGFLGAPATTEAAVPGGLGTYAHYQGGSLYWSPGTGAHEVHGAIRGDWSALGWERSALGFPTTDERGTPDGLGRYNHFQGGSVYWTPGTGAHEVAGAIRQRWAALGWEGSVLGYPTTDERSTPDRVGRYSHFQGGSVYWTPATGAHEVHGAIRADWSALGWERSALGYPTTEETATPDGLGRYNHFQGGSVYWTPSTGAHAVTGAARATWASMGWERSWLGYPTGDTTAVAGGTRTVFAHGVVTWDARTGRTTVTRS